MKMTNNHHERNAPRQIRQSIRTQQQRRRYPPGYREIPLSAQDEATGSMEDGETLGEERGSYPAYTQSGVDISMDTSTYRNNIQPSGQSPNTTNFDTSAYVSSAGFSDSSLPTPQGGSYIDTAAYSTHTPNYDPNPPDLSSSYPITSTSTELSSPFQIYAAPAGGYATTISMSDVPISYAHAGTNGYSICIAPSPPSIEALDGNGTLYTSDDVFVQDQAPPSHVLQNTYDSYGRRWSTDNQQGSTAGSPEQTMQGIVEMSLEEQTNERLGEGSITVYVRGDEDPWSPETAHNNVHDTSNSYFDGAPSGNANGDAEN
ncbi:hypothetical protein F4806DRAFT_462655, partial [Annulohypoxylon nitens]